MTNSKKLIVFSIIQLLWSVSLICIIIFATYIMFKKYDLLVSEQFILVCLNYYSAVYHLDRMFERINKLVAKYSTNEKATKN